MRVMLMLMLGWLHFLVVATSGKKKSSGGGSQTLELDFTGTNRRDSRLPEGEYVFKVEEVKSAKAKSTGNAMVVFTLVVAKGQFQGERVTYRQMLLKQNLWSFRNLLEAMGHKVPEGKIKIRMDTLKGKLVGARVADGEPYNNRIKSEVVDFLKPNAVKIDAHLDREAEYPDEQDGGDIDDEVEEDDLPDDEALDEEENNDDEEEDDEEEGDDEEDDEEEFDPDEEEETPEPDPSSASREEMSEYLGTLERSDVLEWAKSYSVPRVKNKNKKTYIKEILDAIYEGEEDSEDDEEEEEEEKPKPKKKAAASSKKSSSSSKGSKKSTSKKASKSAEEELDDLDLDDIE